MSSERLVLIDLECVPNENATYGKTGSLIVDPLARNTIQLAACELDGTPIVPELNINPCVDWKRVETFLGYTAKCWKTERKNVPAFASSLPSFGVAYLKAMAQIRKQMGADVIFVGHNIKQWDEVILSRQAKEANVNIIMFNSVKGFDTRFVMYGFGKAPGVKDRSWSLGKVYTRVFGGKIKDAHTANGDVQALAYLMREFMRSKGIRTEEGFIRYLKEKEKGMFEIPFTKQVETKGDVSPDSSSDDEPGEQEEQPFEKQFENMVQKIKENKHKEKFKDAELEEIFVAMQSLTLRKKDKLV